MKRLFRIPLILCVVLALTFLITSCEKDKNSNSNGDGTDTHVHNIVTDLPVDATCESAGLTAGSHCSACGEIIQAQDVIQKLDHDYDVDNLVWTWNGYESATATLVCITDSTHTRQINANVTDEVTTAPTCTATGTKIYTATVKIDGVTYTATKNETIAALGHNYIEGACSVCGEADPNYVAPHVHNYEASVTEPTCTEAGYTTYTCECGDSYTDDSTEALGHNYADGVCSVCGDADPDYVAPHVHNYEASVTDPTCTEAGYTTYTCECGDSYTADSIDAFGHSYVDGFCEHCDEAENDESDKLMYSEGLEYTLSYDGTYYIVSGIGECTDTDVVIPNNYNGLPVTSIGGYAFYECTSLASVTIPDSVTSIGWGAFYYCTRLTSITITDSVTSIGDGAFSYCYSLVSITIPDSVTSIGDWAFSWCRSLVSITIPDSVTSIGDYAFYWCRSLVSITIPDSVTSIGDDAFISCSKLVEVINHSSLDITAGSEDNGYVAYYAKEVHTGESKIVNVDDYLFYTYDGVNYLLGYIGEDTELVLPESYNGENYEIYSYVFYDNDKITSITIPDSVTSIGDDAFNGCDRLRSITIGDSVTSIGYGAFYSCDSLVSITIPDSVTSIGESAFSGCYKLVEVINHSSLDITAGSWDNSYVAYFAKEVHTGESKIVTVDDYLFYTYDGVNYLLVYIGEDTELVLPESYNGEDYEIYEYAFYENDKITSITIPDSVTRIGWYAFRYCTNLTSIIIPDSVISIGEEAFYNCTSLTSIYVEENNEYYTSIDGNLYTKDGKTLIQYAIGKSDAEFAIPDSVTSIGNNAFSWCRSLVSITIPDSVTSIGSGAFEGCDSLVSITIPDSVTSIGNNAFSCCTSLVSITIPDSVTSIGGHAFSSCTSLVSITIPDSVISVGSFAFEGCSSLKYNEYDNAYYLGNDSNPYLALVEAKNTSITSCIINENTKVICGSAFSGCTSLTSITIPDSVTSIGWGAFYYCKSLVSITIPDSVTSIGWGAFYWCTSLTIYCEATTQPDGWVDNWKSNDILVVWGCSDTSIEMTILEAINSIDGTKVIVTGTVKNVSVWINSAYMHVTIVDDDGNELYVYKLATEVSLGDIISVTGVMGTYNGARQIAEGSTAEIIGHDSSYDAILEYTISEAAELPDKTNVIVTGTVAVINTPYSETYDNISVTITDGEGNSLFVYRLSGNVEVGDVIKITGYVSTYNGARQIGEGAEFVKLNLDTSTASEGLEYTLSEDGTYYIVSGIGECTDTDLVIPSEYNGLSVREIGEDVFFNCDSLTSIVIPDSVTSIGEWAFSYCTSLLSITIPNSVTSIGYATFACCSSLAYNEYDNAYYLGNDSNPYLVLVKAKDASITSCIIIDNTRFIHSDAFSNCTSLTSVTIGSGVTSIGWYAFCDCDNLTSITIPDSVTSIGDYTFCSCDNLTSITIPDNVTSIGVEAFSSCISLTSINVDENNEYYTSIDGNLYTKDGKTLIQYAIGKSDTEFTIPDSVTNIGFSAFYGCDSLTSITIPDSVTSIGKYAFSDCTSLTSIIIPDSVTSIGDWAFSSCTSLVSITIPDSVTSIGGYAFSSCTSLVSITIPDSVTSIGGYAFSNCTSLTSITIPDSVTSIGNYAFYKCTSLTIYCEATTQPDGWDDNWNPYDLPVIWGYEDTSIEMTILEAINSIDGTKVIVTGTVKTVSVWINSAYMHVTIVDDDGNELYVYKLATEVSLGDIISVTGVMGTYNGARQIAEGSTAEIIGHDSSYDVIPEYTISEAAELPDNTCVIVTGTVAVINTPYSETYDNISVTITDGEGNALFVYRLSGNVEVGDVIKITGYVSTYNEARQIAEGSTAEIIGHDSSYDVIPEYTISEAAELPDNTCVIVTGTVAVINTPYSETYDNISVTITDGEGNALFVYRLSGNVEVGDVIKITGYVSTYNEARQIQGATFEKLETSTSI